MNIFSVVQLIQLCFSQALGWDRGKWLWIPWAPWQAVLIWWSPFRARMRGATSGWCQRGPVCLTEGSVGLGTVSWRLSAPAGKVSWAVLLKALWVFLPPKMMLYCRAILIIYNGSLLSFFMKLSDFWVDCVALESLGLIELRILPGAFFPFYPKGDGSPVQVVCCHYWPYYHRSGIFVLSQGSHWGQQLCGHSEYQSSSQN